MEGEMMATKENTQLCAEQTGAASAAPEANSGEKNKKNSFQPAKLAPYLFCAPFFITYCAFTLFSMVFTFFMSFMEWDGFIMRTHHDHDIKGQKSGKSKQATVLGTAMVRELTK